MDNNIQNYRQPMVTAIGIILGFVLGFAGKWATEPTDATTFSDYCIGIGLLLSSVLFITALYRILNNKFPTENTGEYYQKTLHFFIIGLCVAFLGVLISIFQTIFNH